MKKIHVEKIGFLKFKFISIIIFWKNYQYFIFILNMVYQFL
jgi:hypothetical protein